MEERYPNPLAIVAIVAGVLIIALGLWWGVNVNQVDNAMPLAVVVPTLRPTPPLSVPTARPQAPAPRPTAVVIYVEHNQGEITLNQTQVDVNLCVGLCR